MKRCNEFTKVHNIQSDYDLTDKLTFHVPAQSKFYVRVNTDDELRSAISTAKEKNLQILILGGGSNMLFHRDFEGLVIQIGHKGKQIISDDGRRVTVVVGAGEDWHDFVMFSLDRNLGGIENLSLIPGCVGASPMQNIGAYGVEIEQVLDWVEAIEIATGELRRFSTEDCELGYRESIFKSREKDKWVIVRVAFNLDRESELVTSYGALMSELSDIPENKRTHRDVSDAVIRIRRSKLPDPDVLGNAGSFFKNPIVSKSDFNELQATHSDIPHYPQENGDVKLAAGWLIDSAGWKGHDRGTHGVHELQALVLVNKGGASGEEVWSLAKEIMASVEEKFGVRLHPEVNQIGL
jgi:UDP-N-acetylmuramate dehydrogenase